MNHLSCFSLPSKSREADDGWFTKWCFFFFVLVMCVCLYVPSLVASLPMKLWTGSHGPRLLRGTSTGDREPALFLAPERYRKPTPQTFVSLTPFDLTLSFQSLIFFSFCTALISSCCLSVTTVFNRISLDFLCGPLTERSNTSFQLVLVLFCSQWLWIANFRITNEP